MSKINKDHFENLSKEILKINSSLRWIAIADSNGTLLNIARRDGLEPLMTRQENQEYTLNAISRHKSRVDVEEPHIDSLMREQIIPMIKDNIQYFE